MRNKKKVTITIVIKIYVAYDFHSVFPITLAWMQNVVYMALEIVTPDIYQNKSCSFSDTRLFEARNTQHAEENNIIVRILNPCQKYVSGADIK